MSKRRIIDTNLIVRHLVQDHEEHARIAGRLFDACDRGDLILVLLPAVLAECVFVLDSFYKHPRAEIASALRALISSPGVEMEDASTHFDALNRYGKSKVHFVDCCIAAVAAAGRVPVATLDRGFRQFADVRIAID